MKQVVILASGNSVNEGIELGLWEKIKGMKVWSLNHSFRAMPYLPTKEIWVDKDFFTDNIQDLWNLKEKGVKLICRKDSRMINLENMLDLEQKLIMEKAFKDIEQYEHKNELKNMDYKCFNDRFLFIGKIGLCGMFATSLAVKKGYDEIFWLGQDFGNDSLTNKQTHFYQNNIKVKSTGIGVPQVYRESEPKKKRLKDVAYNETEKVDGRIKKDVEDFKVFLNHDIKIWNVSINSNIDYYEKISYDNFFNKINVG